MYSIIVSVCVGGGGGGGGADVSPPSSFAPCRKHTLSIQVCLCLFWDATALSW